MAAIWKISAYLLARADPLRYHPRYGAEILVPTMKRFPIMSFSLLSSLLILVVVLLFLISIMQRKMQYFPSHVDYDGAGRAPFVPLVDDQHNFMGYYRPTSKLERIIVFFHGNAGEAWDRDWLSRYIPDTRFMLVLAEYPGYGAKQGTPTEKSIFADAEEILGVLQSRWVAPVTVLGESLGSGVACYVASKKNVDRLALISPFSSALEVAKIWYPYLPVDLLMKDKYLSVEYVKTLKIPLHIIHGESDNVIPIALARSLFDGYPGAMKNFTSLPSVGHNDIVDAMMSSTVAMPFKKHLLGSG